MPKKRTPYLPSEVGLTPHTWGWFRVTCPTGVGSALPDMYCNGHVLLIGKPPVDPFPKECPFGAALMPGFRKHVVYPMELSSNLPPVSFLFHETSRMAGQKQISARRGTPQHKDYAAAIIELWFPYGVADSKVKKVQLNRAYYDLVLNIFGKDTVFECSIQIREFPVIARGPSSESRALIMPIRN